MSIYADLLNAVSKGKKFKIDLINKSLWIGKNQIIKDGEIVNEQDKGKELIEVNDFVEYKNIFCMGCENLINESPWEWIEFLYYEFKHSVPKENGNKRSHFKALSVDELTDSDLAFNESRDLLQARLEGYILLGSLNDWIKWEHGDNWFWQSKEDSDLVILRNWVE